MPVGTLPAGIAPVKMFVGTLPVGIAPVKMFVGTLPAGIHLLGLHLLGLCWEYLQGPDGRLLNKWLYPATHCPCSER